jgi:enterobactin synthetase component D
VREAQSAAGRAVAKRLLAQLGEPDGEVGSAGDGSPIWPNGCRGSISHSDTLVFVAVARADGLESLGIDVEPIFASDIFGETAPVLFDADEMSLIEGARDPLCAATIFFAAKEALYKCLYPMTGTFFEFREAAVLSLDLTSGRVEIELRTMLSGRFRPGRIFAGTFAVERGSVFTAFEYRRPRHRVPRRGSAAVPAPAR